MNQIPDLDVVRSGKALQELANACRRDMQRRWPKVDFDSNVWEIHTLYGTRMLDVWFPAAIADFEGKDSSYILACRCLIARKALEGKVKTWRLPVDAWRLLRRQRTPLGALRPHHLHEIEDELVKTSTPLSAKTSLSVLSLLSKMLEELARLEVLGHLGWGPAAASKAILRGLELQGRKSSKNKKSIDVLDRQIEGLSDATRAMLLGDKRLSAMDRSAIAVANILMCAPSRINEPLCMRITDRFTIDDYAVRPNGEDGGALFQMHQLLLMKGSKGAALSGKPILNFMLGLSDACWNVILGLGQRSRSLLRHYEQTPDQIFLPPELEHLRGRPVTCRSLWQIVHLTDHMPASNEAAKTFTGVWTTFVKRHKDNPSAMTLVDNPLTHKSDGQRNNFPKLQALSWQALEAYLLGRVRDRMDAMRRVSNFNSYGGALSEMLMLVDTDRTPYLPQAWNDSSVRGRLKSSPWSMKIGSEPSVFKKLGLQMTRDGELVDCYIEPHDTRRWLTTKALEARERLSDVLINKWANRLDVAQLAAYDLRTSEQRAAQVAVPVPEEMQSITTGLKALDGIESSYGLRTDIAVAQGDALAVTSVEAVMQATENRPVARSGNQIIILYPNRFGVCLHQHHETPCRAYGSCSEGCNELLTIKGHLPTNQEWRKQDDLNNRSIVNQLQSLIIARNRGIADDPATLDAHLLALVKGVDAQAIAEELVEHFHELKWQIHDMHFRNALEAAFVARGVVTRLDDPLVSNGALIKYHNPSKHASPGYERAIEAQCGGRDEMEMQDALFHENYPQLGPQALRLEDDRHLLEGLLDDGEEGSDEQVK